MSNIDKNPSTLEEAFQLIAQEMEELFIKKYKDYGKGNILDTEELGIAFRMNDKLNRLKNLLLNHKDPQNEPIDETWNDLAIYSMIAIMYRRGWFQKLEPKDTPPSKDK